VEEISKIMPSWIAKGLHLSEENKFFCTSLLG